MSRQRDTDAIELGPKTNSRVRPDEAQDDDGRLPTLGRIHRPHPIIFTEFMVFMQEGLDERHLFCIARDHGN